MLTQPRVPSGGVCASPRPPWSYILRRLGLRDETLTCPGGVNVGIVGVLHRPSRVILGSPGYLRVGTTIPFPDLCRLSSDTMCPLVVTT